MPFEGKPVLHLPKKKYVICVKYVNICKVLVDVFFCVSSYYSPNDSLKNQLL